MTSITPLQALRRLVDIARLIDADECPEFYNQLQGELTVAGAVLAEPEQEPLAYIRPAGLTSLKEGRTAVVYPCYTDSDRSFCVYSAPISAQLSKHADDFAHFLSYSGLSAESEEVKEKMRRAFEAGQPPASKAALTPPDAFMLEHSGGEF